MYSLEDYVGGGYGPINRMLRGEAAGRTKSARVAAYNTMLEEIRLLEIELHKRPRLIAGTKVYRRDGPTSHYTKLNDTAYQAGDTFKQNAFLSTSRDIAYKTPQGEEQLVMEITCSANSKGYDVASVRGIEAEAEILFDRNTRFLIKSIKSASGARNTLWVMTELTLGQ